MSSQRPKWIQSAYDEVEYYAKRKPHKLTKREFMRGMTNGKCNRVPEGSGTSDSDLLIGKWRNRLRKLQKEHPSEVDIFTDDETYTCGHIPVGWLKIHPPRVLSDDQKAELAERMRKLREVQDADG